MMITFGEVRALVQQPRSALRDLGLCEMLRDVPRHTLRERGLEEYIVAALLDEVEQARYGHSRGDLYRALRRGELVGAARELVLDLRGYKRPTDRVFDAVIQRSMTEPVAHLMLDYTMCGADWMMRLLRLGNWPELRWISARGCLLGGGLDVVLEALPERVVALMCGGNALEGADMRALASHAEKLSGLRWLDLSGSVAGSGEIDAWIARSTQAGVRLVGLDVSEVEGFADEQLEMMMEGSLHAEMCCWRGLQCGVSEYGLPALLWGVPLGQLEVVTFGDWRSERIHFLDEEAILALFEIPAFEHIYALELAYSAMSLHGAQAYARPERVMLEPLLDKSWFARLERLGLRGFDFTEVCRSGLLDGVDCMRELSLTKMWSRYSVGPFERGHDRSAVRLIGDHLQHVFVPGKSLDVLELGLTTSSETTPGQRWDGWEDHDFRDQLVMKLVDGLPWRHLGLMVMQGFEITHGFLYAMRSRATHTLTRCQIMDVDVIDVFSSISENPVLSRCACIETDDASWSIHMHHHVRSAQLHPRMKLAIEGSLPESTVWEER